MAAGLSGRPQQRVLSLVTLFSHDTLQLNCFPQSANLVSATPWHTRNITNLWRQRVEVQCYLSYFLISFLVFCLLLNKSLKDYKTRETIVNLFSLETLRYWDSSENKIVSISLGTSHNYSCWSCNEVLIIFTKRNITEIETIGKRFNRL